VFAGGGVGLLPAAHRAEWQDARCGRLAGGGGDGLWGAPFGVVVAWEGAGGGFAKTVNKGSGFAGLPAFVLAGLIAVTVAGFDYLHRVDGPKRGAANIAAGDDFHRGWTWQAGAGALAVAEPNAFDVFHQQHGGGFGLGFVITGPEVVGLAVVIIRERALPAADAVAFGGDGEVDEVVFVADVGTHDVILWA